MDMARGMLILAALLHFGFVVGEMWPWGPPLLLRSLMKKRNLKPLNAEQLKLVATIVRNAGIYNVILTAGFVWSLCPGRYGLPAEIASCNAIRSFFFGAATIAGLFGYTLSPLTLIQALVGIVGLCCVWGS